MYKCKCGKEFDKPNNFNAHKSHCRAHLGEERYLNRNRNSAEAIRRGTKIRSEKCLLKKEEELARWVSEKHECKRCHKIMSSRFGSGVYCSRKCANTKKHSDVTKKKISEAVSKTLNSSDFKSKFIRIKVICEICGKEVAKSSYKGHLAKHNSLVTVVNSKTRIKLNITNRDLDEYRKSHIVCEICGRTETASTGKDRSKFNKLTIDHDHKTNKFRGLLCFKCNTNLGFYEKYKDDFERYLQSKK